MEVAILLIIVHGCILGFFCQQLAEAKGYNDKMAFWTGFFTGIFGLIFMAGMPDKNRRV